MLTLTIVTGSPNITLRQGLEKFYHENRGHLNHQQEGLPDDVRSFFKAHDIAHVLFDCDISLYGEGSVKIWTIFGTSLGFWNHISLYRKANAFELSRKFSFSDILTNIFRFLFSIPVLILRARRMHKRWPWSAYEPYMDMPISEIRQEFNIQA
ncbi:MAG: hypothetical protein HKO93_01800 [Flavobacteriales bacterium]|nr:hypothetical protein [Flavobacteriales bacterium]